jgi:membrane protease YdiL (CAAX protease family)
MGKHWRRAAECALLFLLLPILLVPLRAEVAVRVIPATLAAAACCTLVLLASARFDRRRLWRTRHLRRHLAAMLALFVPAGLLLLALTYRCLRAHFLAFPAGKPLIWLLVMGLYPVLAAYPQEVIFRGFFFHRYGKLFPNKGLLLLASSCSFALAHLFFANWIAPVLAFFGGLLFGYRYLQSDSILIAGIEHALWGNCLFTLGIGWFFYGGAV